MPRKTLPLLVILLTGITFIASGCSVKRAASIKTKYQPSTLAYGQNREFVLSQLGKPESTRQIEDFTVDVYRMKTNHPGWGYARATAYGFLDVGTFGLWELLGTPLESWIQNEQAIAIQYDHEGQIDRVTYNQ